MTLRSDYRELTSVRLPSYAGRQLYMHTFDLAAPEMPEGYEDYLRPVRELCQAAGAYRGTAHMTVDEKIVLAGMSQRRPGPHVDGCFMPARRVWGHDTPPTWAHGCNNIYNHQHIGRMPVIVASDVVGCMAWKGIFNGTPKSDGDLSHLSLPTGEVLHPNVGYLLSPDCVHESLRMAGNTRRTFLRIALPVDFPFLYRSPAV